MTTTPLAAGELTRDDALAAIDLLGRAGLALCAAADATPYPTDRWWTHRELTDEVWAGDQAAIIAADERAAELGLAATPEQEAELEAEMDKGTPILQAQDYRSPHVGTGPDVAALAALVDPTVVRRVGDLLLASAGTLDFTLEVDDDPNVPGHWHELLLAADVLRCRVEISDWLNLVGREWDGAGQ